MQYDKLQILDINQVVHIFMATTSSRTHDDDYIYGNTILSYNLMYIHTQCNITISFFIFRDSLE